MTEYEILINNLKTLELERIPEILPDYLNHISKNPPSLTTSLCKLTNDEINFKNERASEGIIKSAGFPFRKSLDSFDFSFQPSISKNQIIDLATLRFLDENENIIFVGNPGVGKTHLAIALGMIAAEHRKSVYFITCHNLISKLNRAHNENRL
ncbi:MAG: ATP-binding protein, partial [Clostridia bacterium]